MSPIDYSARDKVVRHNVYASVRRRNGLPHEAFADYWRDVHATLCSRLPGLGFYVQQHFARDGGANLWPVAAGVREINAVLDGSAELGFCSSDDQARFAAAGAILYADEANSFDEAVAYSLPQGSMTFVDREEDGTRNGPDRFHRVHVYMSRRPGTDSAKWLADTGAELSEKPGVQKWKLHLPEPYDNARPAPPSPGVGHTVDQDRVNLAVAEVAFLNARVARELFATDAFKRMLDDQVRHLSAVGAYRVTAFYTFVRDGRLTTAGLRGSRQAELIDAMGAINHLTSEIEAMFVHS